MGSTSGIELSDPQSFGYLAGFIANYLILYIYRAYIVSFSIFWRELYHIFFGSRLLLMIFGCYRNILFLGSIYLKILVVEFSHAFYDLRLFALVAELMLLTVSRFIIPRSITGISVYII